MQRGIEQTSGLQRAIDPSPSIVAADPPSAMSTVATIADIKVIRRNGAVVLFEAQRSTSQ
jgi:hypothetical protein